MVHSKIEGIIVKISPFKEFDKVITLFSPHTGVIRIIGKGVRRPRSQRSYHLDLLNHVDLDLESSGGSTSSLWYLREATTRNAHRSIKNDTERFGCGSIIALFITRMLPEGAQHQSELFDLTLQALAALNNPENKTPNQTLMNYLTRSVKLLGHLEHTLRADRLESELLTQLEVLDPQFTLHARRTLSIFSSL